MARTLKENPTLLRLRDSFRETQAEDLRLKIRKMLIERPGIDIILNRIALHPLTPPWMTYLITAELREFDKDERAHNATHRMMKANARDMGH